MNPRLLGAVSAGLFLLGVASTADAVLVSKLGGQVVYDDDRDITWLADANLAESNTFGVDGVLSGGIMTWDVANSWIGAMNAAKYLGFEDWRLPTVLVPDSGCTNANGTPRDDSQGWDCAGSEMGHLFYDEFNADRLTSVLDTGNATELAKFTNIQSSIYWTGTELAPFSSKAWRFLFGSGAQDYGGKPGNLYAWALRSGDVSAVPVPAAVWLFGSGLISLLGLAKRKC